MRRVMVRMDDDLYDALDAARHDDRKTINAFVCDLIRDRIDQPGRTREY